MNTHRLMVLGAVALVAAGAALWSSQTRRAAQEDVVSQPLIPGLEAGMNTVTQFRVVQPGDVAPITIRRIEDAWLLVERDNHVVDTSALRDYLLKLARAKKVEPKTDTPSLYERLGVEEIDATQAQGVQIEIDGLAQPVKLIIGHNVARGTGTYVRAAGEAQSWLADADLAVEKVAANWLLRDLVDVAAGRVQRVTLTPPAGTPIEIVRAADAAAGDFVIANLPRGREAASDFVADATAGFLSGLRFDDVLRAADAAPPADGVTRASFATEDGVGVNVSSWAVGDKTHAQFSASLDEAVAAAFVAQAQAKALREHEAQKALAATAPATADAASAAKAAEPASTAPAKDAVVVPVAATDPAADREQRLAALRAEVETLKARFSGKTFVLPSFKSGNLSKTLEDYLKPKA